MVDFAHLLHGEREIDLIACWPRVSRIFASRGYEVIDSYSDATLIRRYRSLAASRSPLDIRRFAPGDEGLVGDQRRFCSQGSAQILRTEAAERIALGSYRLGESDRPHLYVALEGDAEAILSTQDHLTWTLESIRGRAVRQRMKLLISVVENLDVRRIKHILTSDLTEFSSQMSGLEVNTSERRELCARSITGETSPMLLKGACVDYV